MNLSSVSFPWISLAPQDRSLGDKWQSFLWTGCPSCHLTNNVKPGKIAHQQLPFFTYNWTLMKNVAPFMPTLTG